MDTSKKLLKLMSSFIENGILTTQDARKEILTNLKFKRDDLIQKLDLVSREDFEALKKLVQKLDKEIKNAKKAKKTKKAKKS
tara:strand:- start:2536 stop:2781 length:246 start_codon:yes stop_codon:yes gene_type:complete